MPAPSQRRSKDFPISRSGSFSWAYYQGYTRDELAERLAMPVATVKSHLRRGLLRMKEGLER